MTQQSTQQPKEVTHLRQLIGEWTVGVAMKLENERFVSGCGEMSAVELGELGVNSEMNMHLEGYDDYYENDFWSFDRATGKVHMYGITSEGLAHDHVGVWVNDKTLELSWRGTFEDQEMEEHIIAKWIDKDQFELKETNYQTGKKLLQTDYVFKRKEANATS
jgi:hypothetical protein